MKIIVIGAGIGGLAAYHALRKYLPTVIVKVYETYPSPSSTASVIGGGIGLAPNGQRVIADISSEAIAYIRCRGFQSSGYAFRNEKGKLLGRKSIQPKEEDFGQMMIARAVVQESLLIGVDEDAVYWGRKVVSVKETIEGVEVVFEDGMIEHCDLVVGADGVHSTCRDAIFGKTEYQPRYDGLTGIGGFLPLASLAPSAREGLKQDPVTMTFSRSGFFGYSLVTPIDTSLEDSLIIWWSTFEVNPPPTRNTVPEDIHDQLLSRHGAWKSPLDSEDMTWFRQIITLACGTSGLDVDPERRKWLILPRYTTDRLPQWTSLWHNSSPAKAQGSASAAGAGRIVLLGDAAHVIPPDSGQGVSCAVEDALTLALLLRHYSTSKSSKQNFNANEFNVARVIQSTAKAYETIRLPRVGAILDVGKRRASNKRELGFLGEKLRDLACKLPSSVVDRVYDYDVAASVDTYIKVEGRGRGISSNRRIVLEE